ncbi:uncharacterized protein LOC123551903 [Mercenaria mercenaria]|uniref:uncharacterized protein LOC123551903 n=1 Tax=Mercenaria mercenaria TaxID=6596 RepID=UPI00234F9872|nr:uncharacterized protein LOC123551903 [Mercenaria mercenaria]
MNLIATSHKYRKKVEDENSSTHSKKMLETMCTIMKKICCGLSCSKNYTDDFTEPVHVQESTQEDKRLLLLNSTDTLNKATAISLDEPETVNYYDTTKYSDFKSASGSAKEAGSFRSIIATTAEENLLSSRQVEQNDNTVKKIVDENGERMKVSSTTQLFQSNGDVSVVMPPVGTSIAFEGFAQTEIHFSGEAKITSDDKKLAETQEGKFGIKDCSCGKQVNLIGVHMRTDEAVNSCLGLCQYAAGFTQNFDEDNTAAKYVLPGQNFPENQGEIGQVILPDPSFSADETEVKKLAQHFDVQDENSVVATEYSLCTFTLEKDSKTFTSSDINSKPKPTCSDTFKIKMRTDLPETKCEKSHELSQLNATGKERNSKTVEYSEVIWFCNQKETGNLCRPEIGDSESDIRLDYYERISDSNCVTYECNFDALAGADSIYEAALRDRTDEKDNRLFGYIQGNEIIKSEMSKSVCRTACKQKFFQKLFDNFIKDMNGEFSTLQEQKEKVSITNENAREFLSEDIQEDFNLNRIAFQETSIKNDINTVVNKKSITAEKKMLTHRKEMTRHRQETSVLEVDSVDNGHYLYPSVQTVENRNGMLECSIYCKHRKSTLPNEELSYSLVDSGLGSLSASRKNSSSFINKGNTSFTDLYLELDVHKHGTYVSKELQTRKNVKRRKGGFKICRQIVKKKSMIKKMKKYLNQYLANAGRRLAKSIAREIHIEPRSYLVFVLGPPYFDIINNGPPPPLQERMRYEWFRLATFHNYTGNGNSLALAGNGFWHDHTRGPTSTRCYLCDACHSSLEMFDDINAEHRRQSPNCPFHENSGQEPVNIPISSGYNEGGASVQTRTSGSTVTAAYTSVTASSFIRSSDAAVNETIRSLQSGQALSSAGENVPQQRTEDPESRDFPLSEQHTQQALRHTGLACSNVTGSAGNGKYSLVCQNFIQILSQIGNNGWLLFT